MIYLAILGGVQLLVIAWLVFFIGVREREHSENLQALIEANTSERHMLLSRIQHPETIPLPPAATAQPMAPSVVPSDIGELAKVGRVAPRRPEVS